MKRLAVILAAALLLAGCAAPAESGSAAAQSAALAETPQSGSLQAQTLQSGEVSEAAMEWAPEREYDLEKVASMNLVLGLSGSQDGLNYHWAECFRQLVQQRSGGRITIDIYSDSILGTDLAVAEDCRYGTVDIQITSPAAIVSLVPEASVFDMPFLFSNVDDLRAALRQEELFDYLAAGYDRAGLVLLSVIDEGFRELTLSKPVASAADFKGLGVRCILQNTHHEAFWQAMGFQTVGLDIADVYLALQNEVIDGQENPYEQVLTRNFYEVQKYVTNSNHLPYVGAMQFSRITWDSLSATSQQLLRDAANDCRDAMPAHVDKVQKESLQKLLHYGMRMIDFDSIPGLREWCRETSFPVAYQSVAADTGTEILDAWCRAAGVDPATGRLLDG